MKNIKHAKVLLFIGGLILLAACGGNRATGNRASTIEGLIESREFEIENRWATPLGAGMVNLIGNPNFIRFKGDSLDIFLPYFGVRHSGGGYGTEGGIRYEGPAKNLTVTREEEKERYVLKFEGNQGTENLLFRVEIYSSGRTNTSVNSSQRNSISYRGEVQPLTEE